MSDNHRLPVDELALDAFWNEVVAGSATDRTPVTPLPADVVQAIRTITAIDPAPQSSSVRERAWIETWDRIQHLRSEQETTMPAQAFSGAQGAVITGSTDRSGPSPSANSRAIPRGWAAAAAFLAVLLVAFGAYIVVRPDRSNPDDGPVIPAAVVQESTPAPVGTEVLRVDLPASRVWTTGSISSGWGYTLMPPTERPYRYTPYYCCPGPWLEYVLEGQLLLQSEEPMTIYRSNGSREEIPPDTEVTLATGDAFLAENMARMEIINPGSTATHLLGWVLVNEDGFQGHVLSGFPETLMVDLEFDMQVSPGPATLVLTRYDDPAEIPDGPAPNSYQYVLYVGGNGQGTPVVDVTPVIANGTPVAPAPGEGVYVLDFLMSRPGTPSPEATPGA